MSLVDELGLNSHIKKFSKKGRSITREFDFNNLNDCCDYIEHFGSGSVHTAKNATPLLWEIALEVNPPLFQYYPFPVSEELCFKIIKQYPSALGYIKNPTPEMCLEAVNRNGLSLQYVKEQTLELCMAAVKNCAMALKYVEDQTPEICMTALRKDPSLLSLVKNQTLEMIKYAVIKNPSVVDEIDTSILPIEKWQIQWFEYIRNVEVRRQFIRIHGPKVYKNLNNLTVIDHNDEYVLVTYKLHPQFDNRSTALIFKCPSSGDVYFQEVDPKFKNVHSAVKFLNNNIRKEELAFES